MGKSAQRSMEARMMMMTREQLAAEREERRINPVPQPKTHCWGGRV